MHGILVFSQKVLAKFYGQGFNPNALPKPTHLEQMPPNDVIFRLEAATRQTKTKGKYHKTRHGFDLLTQIEPEQVRQFSEHAEQLFMVLLQKAGDDT